MKLNEFHTSVGIIYRQKIYICISPLSFVESSNGAIQYRSIFTLPFGAGIFFKILAQFQILNTGI